MVQSSPAINIYDHYFVFIFQKSEACFSLSIVRKVNVEFDSITATGYISGNFKKKVNIDFA